jgi:hypothetical protein
MNRASGKSALGSVLLLFLVGFISGAPGQVQNPAGGKTKA